METHILGKYKTYKHNDDRDAGREIAHYMYHELGRWLEQGKPDEKFLQAFNEFFTKTEEYQFSSQDLIDLGLMHTAEAVSSYQPKDDPEQQITKFYLNEARLPFFASIDDEAYRMLKNFEFSEIDFQIYEIIGGDFPHDAAQNFLMHNEWVDIWIALRYLDTMPDAHFDLELIERMMAGRDSIHEKLILLGYLCVVDLDLIEESLDENIGRSRFNFPSRITRPMLAAIHKMIRDHVHDGELDVHWEQDLDPQFLHETVFVLLVYFEITHASLLPGWIRLLESGMLSTWTTKSVEDGHEIVYQPIAEFTGSILSLLTEEDLHFLLETSLILPSFFESLPNYNPEAFQNFLLAFVREDQLLLAELELALPTDAETYRDRGDDLGPARWSACAGAVGFQIILDNEGRPKLMPAGGHN